MKIQEIYREDFIEKMKLVNPKFYLFRKDLEDWETFDWELWGKICSVFLELMRE